MITFKVPSELYGITDCCIHDLERAIKIGAAPCGDGNDYRFTPYELEQLKSGVTDIKPSSELKYPLNLVALLRPSGKLLSIPQEFRLNKKQYNDLKTVVEKAGGKYKKNSFEFEEDGITVYNRIINGENYNMKKKFQFFETQSTEAKQVVALAEIKPSDKVLEPSAGRAALIKAMREAGHLNQIWVSEIDPLNKPYLEKYGVYFNEDDFLQTDSQFNDFFDVVIANPPFTKNQDIDHIRKMFQVCKPGGRIVSIASISWKIGSQKKQIDFREWLTNINATIIDIEAGAFKDSGTNTASCIIKIIKP